MPTGGQFVQFAASFFKKTEQICPKFRSPLASSRLKSPRGSEARRRACFPSVHDVHAGLRSAGYITDEITATIVLGRET